MIVISILYVAVVVGILLLVRYLIRGAASNRFPGSVAERLRKLDALRESGSVTQDEYDEQRRRILAEL